jgi:hypothetical protein
MDETAVTESILEAVRSVRYGSIEVVIHDARVVQIVRTEKWADAPPVANIKWRTTAGRLHDPSS